MEKHIKDCDDQDDKEPRPPGGKDSSKGDSGIRCDQGEGAAMVYKADNKKNGRQKADKTETDAKIRNKGVLRKSQQKDERVRYCPNYLPNNEDQ